MRIRHALALVAGAAILVSVLPAVAQETSPPAANVAPPPGGTTETAVDAPAAGEGDAASAPVENAAAGAADDVAPATPSLLPPQPTDADPIVEGVILPAAERLTSATIALQNAIVRHCVGSDTHSLEAVDEAFAAALVAAGATEPHAFGTEDNRAAPALIMTEVANTAFSSSRLEGIMNARIAPPVSLAALAAEEPGLTGLPALERLLLRPPYAPAETLQNRCRLAIPVAANVRAIATVVEETWRRRAVDPQWSNEEPELADRLRLRDLIQAMIDVSDRLDRDVSQFGANPRGNERLPFADKRRMEMYLDAVSTALLREAEVVARFATPGSPAADTLARVTAALQQGRELLPESDEERRSAPELFRRAQQEVAQLPAAFNFAPEAFQRPLASFEPAAPAAATAPAPPQASP